MSELSGSTSGLVFIVEDHEGVRDSFCSLVTACGFACESFASVRDLLQSLETRQPDLVIIGSSQFDRLGEPVESGLARNDLNFPIVVLTDDDQVSPFLTPDGSRTVGSVELPLAAGTLKKIMTGAVRNDLRHTV